MIRHTVIVATKNAHKVHELRLLLKDLPIDLVAVSDQYPDAPTVVEDGLTFEANAEKKARAIAAHTMTLCLADDSGLEVDALGGAPGVRSARYARERATDAENNAALIAALKAVHSTQDQEGRHGQRDDATEATARFRCVLALVDPYTNDGATRFTEGSCEGHIATAPRGTHGFGYDPLFVVKELGKTMAELTDVEKSAISHRGVATRKMVEVLRATLKEREAQLAIAIGLTSEAHAESR
ncbi:MAG: RdgB/HAM1 family non-canonical purine NTP pyrophosphatase [Polyangiaceae bacterium]